jgi:23S rRNA (adenine2030-N6)-methyltransferase
MNYRHAFHAGNHADVLKHVILTRLLVHLNKKAKPYRVIDAHAGIGSYALDGVEAGKTMEWEGGIGKLAEPFAPEIEALLAPYRDIIAMVNPDGAMRVYPGSPEIAAYSMRESDRMIANDLHPEDAAQLARLFHGDDRVKVMSLDAATVIKAVLPPPERRGLILIDPPYEAAGEAVKASRMLAEGLKRFATGLFMLWYPLKANDDAATCLEAAKAMRVPGTLKAELRVRELFKQGGLAGSGVIVVNAPWKLDEELALLLPALAKRVGLGNWGYGKVEWLVPPV